MESSMKSSKDNHTKMEYIEVIGMHYHAYGIDISNSKNFKFLLEIIKNEFMMFTNDEIKEYESLKKDTLIDVLPWLFEKCNGLDEEIEYYLLHNEKLNPYKLHLTYWNNKIFYDPSYPWNLKENEKNITKGQVEETFDLIANAFQI